MDRVPSTNSRIRPDGKTNGSISMGQVVATWWPLAASWMLMSLELPALSAVVARLPDPEVHLAAYGSVVFPLALVIEAPIIMLLAASTALSRDWPSYLRLRQYMMLTGTVLTLFHLVLAFTPLFDVVVSGLMGVPDIVLEPARNGMRLMTPWSWSIAYRRFNQGVLIRFGHSGVVTQGSVVRLLVDIVILFFGYFFCNATGTVVASSAVALGVIAEAVYVGVKVQPVLRNQVRKVPRLRDPLTLSNFLHFYIPLALTSLLSLIIQPLGSAAISRMPHPIESLAVWPVVFGFVFLLRSLGLAYQEVVVALIEKPGSYSILRSFSLILAVGTTVGLVMVAATPLSSFWFKTVSGLPDRLLPLAELGLWVSLLMPALSVLRNWYQGILVYHRKTRRITEAVVVFLAVCGGFLWLGARWDQITGLYVALFAFSAGAAFQVVWVGWHCHRVNHNQPDPLESP